jgi:2-polyprenyl-3-methyl-5-hydroxy-6-metoxy-1,4-benzoquinol methylase
MNDLDELLPAYFQLMNANGAAHVYREAVRTGILAALDTGENTARQVAENCGTAARPTELVLEALAALALVERNGSGYRLTPLAMLLLSGSYRNLGDEYWDHLPALLKTDQPLVKMDDVSKSEAHYQAQAAILGWMLTPAAQCAADLLAGSLPPRAAILDLGAGSAIWSLTVASRQRDATVTAVDWPGVLEVAAEKAEELGLADRLTTIVGNFHDVALPDRQYDLAIIANVSHLLTAEGNAALFRRARGALRPGGRIAIVDVFPGQSLGDVNRTLYAVGLALRTEQGHVYTLDELRPLLAGAGFDKLRLEPLPVPPHAVGMLLGHVSDSSS